MSFSCNSSAPIVHLPKGDLRGFTLRGIHTFLGVKYADAKRFCPPEPVKPWDGVKNADGYGFTCPIMYDDAPGQELRYAHRYWPTNEHCQYLNVWSSDLGGEKKPVMVWIHGGGYSFGSCLELGAVNGDSLCRNGDVVVVTLNHRLNILGFMDVSVFGKEYEYSANLGLADLVAALEWIKENIVFFGGDPDNVTLFGQSGGGGKIRALMQVPAAEGLFHKAIVQSGVYQIPSENPVGKRLPQAMLKALGKPVDDLTPLQELPYPDLVKLYNQVFPALKKEGYDVGWHPHADGYYLGGGEEVGFTEFARQLPTMSGATLSEFMYGRLPENSASLTEEEVLDLLEKLYGKHTKEMCRLFAQAYPDHPLCDLLCLDSHFNYPNVLFLDAKAEQSTAPTYSYMLTYNFPLYDGSPAWHCSEIPFVYHSTDEIPVCSEPVVAKRLEQQMCTAWTNFAKYGDPSCSMLPQWKPYRKGDEVTMIFDRTCRTAVNHARELLKLHAQIESK